VHRRRGSRKGFESIPRALESGAVYEVEPSRLTRVRERKGLRKRMAGWVNGRRTSAAIEELGKQYNSRTEKRQSCHLVKAYFSTAVDAKREAVGVAGLMARQSRVSTFSHVAPSTGLRTAEGGDGGGGPVRGTGSENGGLS